MDEDTPYLAFLKDMQPVHCVKAKTISYPFKGHESVIMITAKTIGWELTWVIKTNKIH